MKKVAPKPKAIRGIRETDVSKDDEEEPAANEIWSAPHFEKLAKMVAEDLRANKFLLVHVSPVGPYNVAAPAKNRKFASLRGRFVLVEDILKDKASLDAILKSARLFFFLVPVDQVSERALEFHKRQNAAHEKDINAKVEMPEVDPVTGGFYKWTETDV